MTRLPYPIGLLVMARGVNRDADRTEYAQRKAGRGIRIERIRGRVCVVRTVAAQALPITSYQLSRFA